MDTDLIKKRRCLILNCSRYKQQSEEPMAAIDRYDGPKFRMLRGYLCDPISCEDHLTILILSAKFGLIASHEIIPDYDLRMTEKRAWQLRPQILRSIQEHLSDGRFSDLFVLLGRDYYIAIDGFQKFVPAKTHVTLARGSESMKSAQLHRWLYRSSLKH